MYRPILVAGILLIASVALTRGTQENSQEKPKEPQATEESKIPQEDIDKKNPVKTSPEGLAAARKVYGYDCEMCHGPNGDGKGDVADSMKLTMHDWHDPAALAGKTDGEIFYIISKGKGKMVGEGDREPETMRWNLVNLVRSLAKKESEHKAQPD
ncbi:MAG TPA: c-type cytochrome [Candidatus Acidoferrum sp.]|nr:c-type cytochrome [Candidatus Acidoferrum sp.]